MAREEAASDFGSEVNIESACLPSGLLDQVQNDDDDEFNNGAPLVFPDTTEDIQLFNLLFTNKSHPTIVQPLFNDGRHLNRRRVMSEISQSASYLHEKHSPFMLTESSLLPNNYPQWGARPRNKTFNWARTPVFDEKPLGSTPRGHDFFPCFIGVTPQAKTPHVDLFVTSTQDVKFHGKNVALRIQWDISGFEEVSDLNEDYYFISPTFSTETEFCEVMLLLRLDPKKHVYIQLSSASCVTCRFNIRCGDVAFDGKHDFSEKPWSRSSNSFGKLRKDTMRIGLEEEFGGKF